MFRARHAVRAWGEALNTGDKGSAKAMSAACKSAVLQLFCVPVAGEDADSETHRLKASAREREPVQGWWCVSLCNHHHAEQHRIGHGQLETRYNLDLLGLAEEFARRSPHRRKLEWAPK